MAIAITNALESSSGFDSVFGKSRGPYAGQLTHRELLLGGHSHSDAFKALMERLYEDVSKGRHEEFFTLINKPEHGVAYSPHVQLMLSNIVRKHNQPLHETMQEMIDFLWQLVFDGDYLSHKGALYLDVRASLTDDGVHYMTRALNIGLTDIPAVSKVLAKPRSISGLRADSAIKDVVFQSIGNIFEELGSSALGQFGFRGHIKATDWEMFAENFWNTYFRMRSSETPLKTPMDKRWLEGTLSMLFFEHDDDNL